MTEGAPKDHWLQEIPPDAGVRDQLIAAAGEHFSQFGYEKTTLAELAKAIGFSKTYFYRFFDSKQAIGEAICAQCLNRILAAIDAEVAAAPSAAEKLRAMLRTIPAMGIQFFCEKRKLYDVAASSFNEGWGSSRYFREQLVKKLQEIVQEGRDRGEFERKTPIDEVTRAIMGALDAFIDPRFLQYRLDSVPERSNEVVAMVLRSLAP